MVDTVAIVSIVISFLTALLAALITGWFTYFSDERKRLNEAEKLIAKYRDPLLLAAQDLQSRLYNITDMGFTSYFRHDGELKDNLLLYTAFVVGQYLSWTHILRLQAQFLRFSTDKQNRDLTRVLGSISYAFSTDKYNNDGVSYTMMLWRGQQTAIGELMTIKERSEWYCMGYAAFYKKWVEDRDYAGMGSKGEITRTSHPSADGGDGDEEEDGGGKAAEDEKKSEDSEDRWSGKFRRWFRPLIEGVTTISIAKNERRDRIPDQRLRRLQHLLLDLIHILDKDGVRSEAIYTRPCHRAAICKCSKCDGNSICPCDTCNIGRGSDHL